MGDQHRSAEARGDCRGGVAEVDHKQQPPTAVPSTLSGQAQIACHRVTVVSPAVAIPPRINGAHPGASGGKRDAWASHQSGRKSALSGYRQFMAPVFVSGRDRDRYHRSWETRLERGRIRQPPSEACAPGMPFHPVRLRVARLDRVEYFP